MTSRVIRGGEARGEPDAGQEPRRRSADRPRQAARDGGGPIFGWTWLERPRARRAVWAVLGAEIITVAVFSVVYRRWNPADLLVRLILLNDMDIPDPVEENLYHFDENELRRRNIKTLPGSLHDALEEMAKDDLVRETLGDHITDRLLEAKTAEWNEFRMRVTQWELDRYLDIY